METTLIKTLLIEKGYKPHFLEKDIPHISESVSYIILNTEEKTYYLNNTFTKRVLSKDKLLFTELESLKRFLEL